MIQNPDHNEIHAMLTDIKLQVGHLREELDVIRRSDNAYWDVARIARHVGFGVHKVRNSIIKQHGFPRPVVIKGTRHPRWKAEEIRQYCKRMPKVR